MLFLGKLLGKLNENCGDKPSKSLLKNELHFVF